MLVTFILGKHELEDKTRGCPFAGFLLFLALVVCCVLVTVPIIEQESIFFLNVKSIMQNSFVV